MASDFTDSIDDILLVRAPDTQFAAVDETSPERTQRIDTAITPGEQSLNDWLRESQNSFHLGAGITYTDTDVDPQVAYRFADSVGIDPWTPGRVTLLKSTTLAAAVTEDHAPLVGYSAGGEEGVLYAYGNTLRKRTSEAVDSEVIWGGPGQIRDITTDGSTYFVLAQGGVFRGALPDTDGERIYTFSDPITKGVIRYLKDRLWWIADAQIMTKTATPGSPPVTIDVPGEQNDGYVVFDPLRDVTWTDIVEGPNGVFFCGHTSDRGFIYASTVGGSVNAPQVETPRVVASLPTGEVPLAMYSYVGSLIFIGTNAGLRVASIGQDNRLVMGPLIVATDQPVRSIMAHGSYCYFGGASNDGNIGLYRLSLNDSLAANDVGGGDAAYSTYGSLRFPYARDLYLNSVTPDDDHRVTGLCMIGQTGRVAFMVSQTGVVFEDTASYVPSGWIKTGGIRNGVSERKAFAFGRLVTSATPGRAKVDFLDEDDNPTEVLAEYETDEISEQNFTLPAEPRKFASLKVTLSTPTLDPTVTPVLLEYAVKSRYSGIKQFLITIPALLAEAIQTAAGRRINTNPLATFQALRDLEHSGKVAVHTDLATGEQNYVTVESTRHISTATADQVRARAAKEGMCLVVLKTTGDFA